MFFFRSWLTKLATTLVWNTTLSEHRETIVTTVKDVYAPESVVSWITMDRSSNGLPAVLKISTKLPTLAWDLLKSKLYVNAKFFENIIKITTWCVLFPKRVVDVIMLYYMSLLYYLYILNKCNGMASGAVPCV